MSDKLVLAVPSKGRLQENANAFFARAGLAVQQARGARDYRGVLGGVDNVEVAFLSASEIVRKLASGDAHFGVTGEDLVVEAEAQGKVELLTSSASATPMSSWPCRRPGSTCATWTISTTSPWVFAPARRPNAGGDQVRQHHPRFFRSQGVTDYHIVESLGATEGAPAAGQAELIVDITSTGATLVANGLKVLDDGVILRSEANLVASLAAPWPLNFWKPREKFWEGSRRRNRPAPPANWWRLSTQSPRGSRRKPGRFRRAPAPPQRRWPHHHVRPKAQAPALGGLADRPGRGRRDRAPERLCVYGQESAL